MKTRWRVAVLWAVGLSAAGCAEEAGEPDMDMPEAPADAATEEGPGAPPTTDAAAAAALGVDSAAALGTYVTDAAGRAVYLLEGEPEGESTCYDACAEEWPPVLAGSGGAAGDTAAMEPSPGSAEALDAALVGTIERRDGSLQRTYAGHALYYYDDDTGPGQTTGHDVTDQWGEWYLVRPSGEPLEEGGS